MCSEGHPTLNWRGIAIRWWGRGHRSHSHSYTLPPTQLLHCLMHSRTLSRGRWWGRGRSFCWRCLRRPSWCRMSITVDVERGAHPTPCTLHPTPCTSHPTPRTVTPEPYRGWGRGRSFYRRCARHSTPLSPTRANTPPGHLWSDHFWSGHPKPQPMNPTGGRDGVCWRCSRRDINSIGRN